MCNLLFSVCFDAYQLRVVGKACLGAFVVALRSGIPGGSVNQSRSFRCKGCKQVVDGRGAAS